MSTIKLKNTNATNIPEQVLENKDNITIITDVINGFDFTNLETAVEYIDNNFIKKEEDITLGEVIRINNHTLKANRPKNELEWRVENGEGMSNPIITFKENGLTVYDSLIVDGLLDIKNDTITEISDYDESKNQLATAKVIKNYVDNENSKKVDTIYNLPFGEIQNIISSISGDIGVEKGLHFQVSDDYGNPEFRFSGNTNDTKYTILTINNSGSFKDDYGVKYFGSKTLSSNLATQEDLTEIVYLTLTKILQKDVSREEIEDIRMEMIDR